MQISRSILNIRHATAIAFSLDMRIVRLVTEDSPSDLIGNRCQRGANISGEWESLGKIRCRMKNDNDTH